ncbi:hypothetical protein PENTCL1PPCAC_7336, partial [Pristionchus entomophagus]
QTFWNCCCASGVICSTRSCTLSLLVFCVEAASRRNCSYVFCLLESRVAMNSCTRCSFSAALHVGFWTMA